MLTLNRVLVLMVTLLLSGCLNQAMKPSTLEPELISSHGIIFGSLEYTHDEERLIGDTFDIYTMSFESVDSGEVQHFNMQESRYDKELGNTRKSLLLRQIPSGVYKLSEMSFSAGYWEQTFTPGSPTTFEVRPGEAVYVGNYLVERVGASFGVLGHPKIVISNQFVPDLSFARKFYVNMPQDEQVSISPAVPSSPVTFEPVED